MICVEWADNHFGVDLT